MRGWLDRAGEWLARDGRVEAILAAVICVVVAVIFVRYYQPG